MPDHLRVILNESRLESVRNFPRSILFYVAVEPWKASFKRLKGIAYPLKSSFVASSELGTSQL
jgi:hypothetical protein